MVLVSGCLLGLRCRYDAKRLRVPKLIKELKDPLPLCPEQLGGFPTPRIPAEVKGRAEGVWKGEAKVINEKGEDVTQGFIIGAKEVLRLVRLFNIKKAYLKENSPSCGREGVLIPLLKKRGVEIRWIK